MSRERYFILVGCTLLFSAFVVSFVSGEMNLYDILVIAATLTEKGTSTNDFQKLVVILSLFGGITYFFQIQTNKAVLNIDESQFVNFEDILGNLELMGDTMEHLVEESGGMQRKMMKKIELLESSLREMKEIIKEFE
jgi:hypothetical protein